LIRFFLIAAAVVGLDHLTKWMVVQRLPRGEDIPIIGQWVMLTHIKNTGAAFGLFPGSVLPLIVISIVASIVVLVLASRARGRMGRLVPLGLILGGAIGNLIDRIALGRVTDFIHVGIPDGPRWPVFNVADSAVSIGVVLLALGVTFGSSEEGGAGAEGEPRASLRRRSPAPPPRRRAPQPCAAGSVRLTPGAGSTCGWSTGQRAPPAPRSGAGSNPAGSR
jgi:signal peptidase II